MRDREMTAYYNEIDPYAAQWLRNLIAQGHIAPGDVDTRSIVDVRPGDLAGYAQCHFFAGIGVWSYALRRAGWSDDRPVWTGSCPCQPFSAAGKGGGFADERHLWPAFFHLIGECRPSDIIGEQVASADGLDWLDLVQDDLEGADYAFGAVDTSSAIHGAPHQRQRLRWVALDQSTSLRHHRRVAQSGQAGGRHALELERSGSLVVLGQPAGQGPQGLEDGRRAVHSQLSPIERTGHDAGVMAEPDEQHGDDWRRGSSYVGRQQRFSPDVSGSKRGVLRPGPTNGFWRSADWIFCRDGRWRPIEPGTFPLAHGAPARVGRLRAYGNAVDAEATTAFITAVMDSIPNTIEHDRSISA